MLMKMTEELKCIEEMFRDKAPIKSIQNAIGRLREMAAEAEDQAKAHQIPPEEKRILEVLSGASYYVKQDVIARQTPKDQLST